ncbi:MAG TPA: hypothetical protein VJ453_01350 [Terriglobales bacterium]|nr:hypothetical protein [Terriglobales bacterium]
MDYASAEEQKPQISEEIRLIPMWSVALAFAIFAGVQATVHLYLVRHDHNLPPRGFLIFWSVAWALSWLCTRSWWATSHAMPGAEA